MGQGRVGFDGRQQAFGGVHLRNRIIQMLEALGLIGDVGHRQSFSFMRSVSTRTSRCVRAISSAVVRRSSSVRMPWRSAKRSVATMTFRSVGAGGPKSCWRWRNP